MPPLVRVWNGYGTPDGVERYCREHFAQVVLPQLRALDGFLEAQVLVRSLDQAESQVLVVTVWQSLEAIKRFAGEDYAAAVVEPVVRDLLTRFDDRVTHFTVAVDTSSREPNMTNSVPPGRL